MSKSSFAPYLLAVSAFATAGQALESDEVLSESKLTIKACNVAADYISTDKNADSRSRAYTECVPHITFKHSERDISTTDINRCKLIADTTADQYDPKTKLGAFMACATDDIAFLENAPRELVNPTEDGEKAGLDEICNVAADYISTDEDSNIRDQGISYCASYVVGWHAFGGGISTAGVERCELVTDATADQYDPKTKLGAFMTCATGDRVFLDEAPIKRIKSNKQKVKLYMPQNSFRT